MSLEKSRGISLIETVITLAILSFGMVALMKLQTHLIGHSSIAKQQAEAITLAQKKIEELRDFEQIISSNSAKAYEDIKNGSQKMTTTATDFNLSWNVTTNTDPDHKLVDIAINWVDRQNQNHTITLSSVISKTDPASEGIIMGASSTGKIQP